MIAAALLLALLPQDPLPQDPPPAEVAPGEEAPAPQDPGTEGSPDLEAILAEVERLADLVRDGFRKVDTGLKDARDQVSATEEEPPAAFQEQLDRTVADSAQLLADMEELLATIPELKSDSQSSQGQRPQDETRPEDAQNQDASGERRPEQGGEQGEQPQPQDGQGDQEGPQGEGQLPNSYLRLLFDQNAGAWGMLPPRLQEALENAVIEEVPLRYRRWLDEFHRQ